jgi:hypothetical protein
MPYAIATVIYGSPVTDKVRRWFTETEDEKYFIEPEDIYSPPEEILKKLEKLGFTSQYSSSEGTFPSYIGEELLEFDECTELQLLRDLIVKPTEEQSTRALEKIARLPEGLRKSLPMPDVYVVWSSS